MSDRILSQELEGVIPVEISNTIAAKMIEGSVVLRNSRREVMTSPTKKIPVMVNVPGVSWVGEGQKIKVSKASVVPVTLTAKKMGLILVASREALNDPVFNLFDSIKDVIAESFAGKLDRAVLTGEESPFEKNILGVVGAKAITETAALNDDISNAMGLVESNRYNPNVLITTPKSKKKFRAVKDTTGRGMLDNGKEVYGLPVDYSTHFDDTKALMITGDFNNLVTGVMEDLTYTILREGTLTLEDNSTVNLAQEDLIGVRVTARYAAQLLKDDAFAVIKPKA